MSEYVPGTEIEKPVAELIGQDGNAIAIITATRRVLHNAGVPREIIAEYEDKAVSGNYDHLLSVTGDYVHIE